MPKKLYYLSSLTLVFIVPAIFAGFFVWEAISIPHLIIFILLITIAGSLWDIWATKHGPKDTIWLWHFNHEETLGIKLLGLPIEEYLFYIASSLYIIFIWEGIGMAIETKNFLYYLLIPGIGLWTLASLFIPYYKTRKTDRIFE